MTSLIGFVAGLVVFLFWMSIVGNPHVVETVIGLVIALFVWIFVTSTLRKLFVRRPAED